MVSHDLLTEAEALGVPEISKAARACRPVALEGMGVSAGLPSADAVKGLIKAVAEWADKNDLPAKGWALLLGLIRTL